MNNITLFDERSGKAGLLRVLSRQIFTHLSAANKDKENHQWQGKDKHKIWENTVLGGIYFVLDIFLLSRREIELHGGQRKQEN